MSLRMPAGQKLPWQTFVLSSLFKTAGFCHPWLAVCLSPSGEEWQMDIFPGGRKCKIQKPQFGDAGTPISSLESRVVHWRGDEEPHFPADRWVMMPVQLYHFLAVPPQAYCLTSPHLHDFFFNRAIYRTYPRGTGRVQWCKVQSPVLY